MIAMELTFLYCKSFLMINNFTNLIKIEDVAKSGCFQIGSFPPMPFSNYLSNSANKNCLQANAAFSVSKLRTRAEVTDWTS